MDWWQQLILVLGASGVTGVVAIYSARTTFKGELTKVEAQLRDADQQREHERRLRALERRNDAYREYFRWMALIPTIPQFSLDEKDQALAAENAAKGRSVLADLLLYGSNAVKRKAKHVTDLMQEANNGALQEAARALKEIQASGDKPSRLDFKIALNGPLLEAYFKKVWPEAESLANLMSDEL